MLFLNALLCFTFHYFKKYNLKMIKSIISDYYNAEDISVAKEKLMTDIDAVGLTNWNRPVKRRGDNKTKQEIDDILCAITVVDESLSLNKLPKYVTDNLDDIPVMRMEKGELAILISKLDRLEENISDVQIRLNVNNTCNCDPNNCSHFIGQRAASLSMNNDNRSTSNITVARSRMTDSEYPPLRTIIHPSDDNESSDCGTDDINTNADGYTTAITRTKKRRLSRPETVNNHQPTTRYQQAGRPAEALWSNMVSASQPNMPNPNNAIRNNSAKPVQLKKRIIGNLATDSCVSMRHLVKSAKPFIKKSIFAIYNVENAESVASIESYIEHICLVKPVSCFKLGSRSDESSSFRVCVDAKTIDKFLNPENWADGIVIRPWKFKPKNEREVAQNSSTTNNESVNAASKANEPLLPSQRSAPVRIDINNVQLRMKSPVISTHDGSIE